MRLTNLLSLPQPIVDAVANDDYSRGNADISVTSLISPPRQVALLGQHYDELTEDVSDRIYSLFGKAIHKIIESGGLDAIKLVTLVRRLLDGEDVLDDLHNFVEAWDVQGVRERRLFMQVPVDAAGGTWTVSGAMDHIALLPGADGTVAIQDWKTAGVNELMSGVKAERHQQLNVYKVLAELNGYRVSALSAVFILRDWSKVRAAVEAGKVSLSSQPAPGGYPPKHIVDYDIPMWPQDEAFRYIHERVMLHKQAQDAYALALHFDDPEPGEVPQLALPECTAEERWASEPKLAVTKPGAKRASKLVETAEEAAEYIAAHPKDKFEIVERPGESLRCRYFCAVAVLCAQFAAENAAQ